MVVAGKRERLALGDRLARRLALARLAEDLRLRLEFRVLTPRHVPGSMPDSPAQYPEEIRGRTLFSVPGEEKRISISSGAK